MQIAATATRRPGDRNERATGRKAFTLIELLVVIAIIALLIGILLPSLAAVRGSGRKLVCATGQRSMAQAIHLFAADHDDRHQDIDRLAPSEVVDINGRALNGGAARPNGRYNSGLRFAPLFAVGGGTNNFGVRLFGPNYRGSQSLDSNNESYWAVRYDEYLMDQVPHRPFDEIPFTRVVRGQQSSRDYSRDYVDIGDDPERFILVSWETTRCPEARYMAARYRLNTLKFDPYGKYSSFCFNGLIPDRDSGVPEVFFDQRVLPRKLSSIQFNVIMFQDGSEPFLDGNGDMLNRLNQGRLEEDTDVWIPEYFRHGGVCNVALLDGSVTEYQSQFPELGLKPYAGFDPSAPQGGSGDPTP